jgi:hypothetical protein
MSLGSVFSQLRWTLVVAALIALIGTAGPTFSGEAQFQLLIPFDGAVVHSPEILAVFTTAPGVGTLTQLDGRNIPVPGVLVPGDEMDLRHGRIRLTEGRQRIRWLDEESEAELGTAVVTYIPPHSLRTATSPGDRAYAFHTKTQEAGCRDCHSLPGVFETVPDRPLAPAGKVCEACHPDVVSAPNLHGPVAVYSCFMCHSQAFSPARRFRLKPDSNCSSLSTAPSCTAHKSWRCSRRPLGAAS